MKKRRIDKVDISRFCGDIDIQSGRMRGIYCSPEGYQCTYSLSPQRPTAAYAVRGTVSLIDPRTGRKLIHKVIKTPSEGTTDSGKKYNHACSTINAHTQDAQSLRELIASHAQNLIQQHTLILVDSTDKAVPLEEMQFSLAVEIYGKKYASKKSRSAEAQHERMLHLQRVGSMLPASVPIYSISLRMVAQMCNSIGSNWRTYICEARDFLDYALRLKRNSPDNNVFKAYLSEHPTAAQREARKRQASSVNPDILSSEEEHKLNKEIEENIENGIYMGILLVKDAGLSSKEACALTWQDISTVENHPETIQIHMRKDEISGAVHNYTFCVGSYASRVLQKRRAWLEEQYSNKTIAKMTVVSADSTPEKPLESKTLTEASRNILRNYGVGFATLAALKEYEQGAGIKLLQNTYKTRLEEICGLEDDPALKTFLLHQSLTNMLQASYYRSFTDPIAQEAIITYLNRDKRFATLQKHKKPYQSKTTNRGKSIVVYAEKFQQKTSAIIRVVLHPGDKILFSAVHGCKVKITVKKIVTSEHSEDE